MKNLFLIIIFILLSDLINAQNVGIGTSAPNAFAKLEVADTASGILIPRIDSVHRVTITNTKGLLVYDTTSNGFWYNDGTTWLQFATVPFVQKKFANALTQTYLTNGF
jgi:hypothetical protein